MAGKQSGNRPPEKKNDQPSNHNLLIRACQESDLEGIKNLLIQLSQVTNEVGTFQPGNLSRLYFEMTQAPDFYLNLVALDRGVLAGFISIIFYKTFFHKRGTALINELVIDSHFRSRGIGQALIARARQEAVARGMDELEVGTEKSNLAARRFYKKSGFDQEYVLLGMEFD